MKQYENDIIEFRDMVRNKAMSEITEMGTIKPKMFVLLKENDDERLKVVETEIPFGVFKPGDENFIQDTIKAKIIFEIIQRKLIENGEILCFTFRELTTYQDEEILLLFVRNDGLGEEDGNTSLFKIKHDTRVGENGKLIPMGCEFEQIA